AAFGLEGGELGFEALQLGGRQRAAAVDDARAQRGHGLQRLGLRRADAQQRDEKRGQQRVEGEQPRERLRQEVVQRAPWVSKSTVGGREIVASSATVKPGFTL